MKRTLVASVLLAATVLPASAWAPATRVRMIDEAVRLMPASLRTALEGHREELLRGMLAPMVEEDATEHRPPWNGGALDTSIEREARELSATLGEPHPFGEIARGFGGVAHYVADAGFPPGVGRDADATGRYAHFAWFCEDRRKRFPVVFYGHDDESLDDGNWRRFALEVMRRAGVDDERLARAYAAAGDPPDPSAFDDRSIPFAVGSLTYSRSITYIVRVWLAIWQRADGDMGRIPYRSPSESGEE